MHIYAFIYILKKKIGIKHIVQFMVKKEVINTVN